MTEPTDKAAKQYSRRIKELEAAGMTTSDAQGCADAEILEHGCVQLESLLFEELSEEAKQVVRENNERSLDYVWWEFTYEDFVSVLALMDIEVDMSDISFSGFSSQGDGASWMGVVRFNNAAECLSKIMEYAPQDSKLHAIATRLDVIRAYFTVSYGAYMDSCTSHMRITRNSSQYSHSNTMDICNEDMWNDIEIVSDYTEPQNDMAQIAADVLQVCKDLADWLYKELGTQYDHMCSDEYIHDAGYTYSKDGEIV